MDNQWLNRWNERYSDPEYAFGKEPNSFFKMEIQNLKPGKILLAAEGEGRNAVFAALNGWDVSAFDISEEGKKKALRLAEDKGVTIDYRVGELPELGFDESGFDTLALIFAHFPAPIRLAYHQMLDTLVKKGGFVLFEAFGKKHLE